MLPPYQSFHGADLTALGAYDRLIMDDELLPLYGTSQFVCRLQVVECPLVHSRVEHRVARALVLSPVHRRVCVPKKIVRVLGPILSHRYADAGSGVQLPPVQYERIPEFVADPLCDPYRLVGTVDVLKQNDKLVTSEPREGVLWPNASFEAFANGHK